MENIVFLTSGTLEEKTNFICTDRRSGWCCLCLATFFLCIVRLFPPQKQPTGSAPACLSRTRANVPLSQRHDACHSLSVNPRFSLDVRHRYPVVPSVKQGLCKCNKAENCVQSRSAMLGVWERKSEKAPCLVWSSCSILKRPILTPIGIGTVVAFFKICML